MKLSNLYRVKYEVKPEGSTYILVKAPSLMQAMLLAEHSFDEPIKIISVNKFK
jgi:hypothetical protein